MDSLSKFINIILVVVGVFIVTTVMSASLEDRIIEENVTVSVTKFADNVRRQGKITQGMYNAFVDELDATGMLFNINMTYSKKILTPGENNTAVATEECFYYKDIINGLFSNAAGGGALIDGAADGEVWLNKEDTFYVRVMNKTPTFRSKYGKLLPWVNLSGTSIIAHAGGLVRDENWGD